VVDKLAFTNGFFLFNSSSSPHKAGAFALAYHYSDQDKSIKATFYQKHL